MDEEKSRKKLLAENQSLRREITKLKSAETSFKLIEAALQEGQEQYKRLVESITDYIYTVSVENGRPVSTLHGPGCLPVPGYTQEHLHAHSHLWCEMIHDGDRNDVLKQIETILSGETFKPIEHRIIHMDGSIRWVRNTPVRHYDKEGKLIAYDGIIEDVTERKRAELALGESEERFRRALENIPDVIVIYDPDLRIRYINTATRRITGRPTSDFIGKRDDEIWPPEVYETYLPTLRDAFNTREIRSIECTLMLPDNGTSNLLITCVPVMDEKGNVREVLGITHDLTERKKTAEALQESELHYHSLFENMLDGFAYCLMLFENNQPQDFIYLDVNSAFAELTGLRNVVGRKVTEIIPGIKDSHPELFEIYGRVALTGQPERFEIEFKPLNIWLSISVYSPGRGYFVAVFDNITERKKAEAALRESEEKYRRLIENLKERYFFYSHGTDGVFTYLSPSITNVLGYTQEEFHTHYTEYLTDNPVNKYVVSHTDLSITGVLQPHYLVEMFHKDRTVRWLEVTEIPIFDNESRVVAVEGIACDITEKKKADDRLRQEMEVTGHLLMIADATAHTADIDKLMDEVVHCTRRIMGCDICLSYLWDSEAMVFRPGQAHGVSHNLIPMFKTESLNMKIGFVKEAMKKKDPLTLSSSAIFHWIPDINSIIVIPVENC